MATSRDEWEMFLTQSRENVRRVRLHVEEKKNTFTHGVPVAAQPAPLDTQTGTRKTVLHLT